MELFNILNAIVPLDERHWNEISELVEIRHFKRNEYFLKRGDACSVIGFIKKGSFRFVMHNDGNERTFDVSLEDDFVSDYYGILKSGPASFDIIANQKSEVLCLPTADVIKLFDRDMVYQKIGRTIAENEFCQQHERLLSMMYDSPQKRYEDLIKKQSGKIFKLPQHLLANYLGVTKETLSRIRARIVKADSKYNKKN